VKDILDNDVTPNTDITYDSADIVATGLTLNSVEFNTNAKQTMQSLAEAVGTREWGVGPNKKFFFKARSSTLRFKIIFGKDVTQYQYRKSFSELANRVRVEGDVVGGSIITATSNDTASQTLNGLRTLVVQDSSIKNTTDATAVADAVLAEKKDPKRRVSITIENNRFFYEAIQPIGKVGLLIALSRYNQVVFGQKIYNTFHSDQVSRLGHAITDNGILTTLEYGPAQPDVSLIIRQIQNQLEQIRQRDVV